MSISGSYNFNLNVNSIIKRSLQLLTVIGPSQTPAPEDYELALDLLNAMILSWSADGLHLWTEEQSVLYLEAEKISYILGGSSSDRLAPTDYKTELSVAAASSATALTVDDTTDMTIGDVIGIQLDDETMKWTTIATIPTPTTLTITSGLTSAAAIDNNVYWYTTPTGSITNVSQVILRRDNGNDLQMTELDRFTYSGIPNKSTASSPYQYYVDRRRDNLVIYLYGTSQTVGDRIIINHKRAFSDFDSPTDLPDFPREWQLPVIYNLAMVLAPFHEKEDKIVGGQIIPTLATQSLKKLKGWDKEMTSIYFGPPTNGY